MLIRGLLFTVALLGSSRQSVVQAPGGCDEAAACNGTLSGYVSLQGGGVPVGATVFLQPLVKPRPAPVGEYVVRDGDIAATVRGQFHAVVDERGRVQISDVRPGRYIVVVQVPGYISSESFSPTSQESASDSTENIVTVRAGVETTFRLKLQHGGSIVGVARFEGGKPAHRDGPISQEIALTLLSRQPDGSFDYAAGIGAAHTDAVGRFTFANLPRGDFVVMTVIPGPPIKTTQGQVDTMGGLIFSGGTSSLAKASAVHITGTETEETEMVLPTSGLCDVSGRALAPDGSPLTKGLVRLKPVDDPSSGRIPISATAAHIADDGSFRFDALLPERYEVWVELEPEVSFAGMTDDHQGYRMRATPPPLYVSPHVLVNLLNGVTAPIVLRLRSGR